MMEGIQKSIYLIFPAVLALSCMALAQDHTRSEHERKTATQQEILDNTQPQERDSTQREPAGQPVKDEAKDKEKKKQKPSHEEKGSGN